ASLLGCLTSWQSIAQDARISKYAATITTADLKTHLNYLPSDELEGRETGEKGQKLAAEYLRDFYKKIGLAGPVDGGYFQDFQLFRIYWEDVTLKVGKH